MLDAVAAAIERDRERRVEEKASEEVRDRYQHLIARRK